MRVYVEFDGEEEEQIYTPQMTLGELIQALEKLPKGMHVPKLENPNSHRGYYEDVAFNCGYGKAPVEDVLKTCREAVGSTYYGYKGGEYLMDVNSKVWLASYGDVGKEIVGVNSGTGSLILAGEARIDY